MFGEFILAWFIFFSPKAEPEFKITPALSVLASEQISLENRQPNSFVNGVFKDNILLTTAYMDGRVAKKQEIDWEELRKPFAYRFSLTPNQSFAFHDDVYPEFSGNLAATTNAHFNHQEGFKSDGYLMGNGVCHLASLIYLAAKTAGLDAYAPTSHDFAVIPEISKEFGVSIYSYPGHVTANARQNLYITNNKKNPVIFEFIYDGENLKLSVYEAKSAIQTYPLVISEALLLR